MLKIYTESTRRCADCFEPLPNIARRVFKENEGCCPRCAWLHVEVGLDYDVVEKHNLGVKGKSSIVVPRVEFHRPGSQPKNAIPL